MKSRGHGESDAHERRDHPKTEVSWIDVQSFLKKLNGFDSEEQHRLPTEAEWEYACRAGTTTEYFFGDDAGRLGDYAWYGENAKGAAHPVGKKEAIPWGLYDMLGNVWEWVGDWYGKDYYKKSSEVDPGGSGDGSFRVLRGGAFSFYRLYVRCAYRSYSLPFARSDYVGSRIVLLPFSDER